MCGSTPAPPSLIPSIHEPDPGEMKELAIKLREGYVSKAGLHTRECFQVGHTGGGHDRSRDASVSEVLVARRGTIEPPQVGGDPMGTA